MASVLLDLDDVAYIDEVTDTDEELASHSGESNPANNSTRRTKNQVIGDTLTVNINNSLVNELREDRKQQTLISNSRQIQDLVKSFEQENFLRELRDERAKSKGVTEGLELKNRASHKTFSGSKAITVTADINSNDKSCHVTENFNRHKENTKLENKFNGNITRKQTMDVNKQVCLVSDKYDKENQQFSPASHAKQTDENDIENKNARDNELSHRGNEKPSSLPLTSTYYDTIDKGGAKPKRVIPMTDISPDNAQNKTRSDTLKESSTDVPDAPYRRLLSDDSTADDTEGFVNDKKGKKTKKRKTKNGRTGSGRDVIHEEEDSDIRITVTDEEGVEKDAEVAVSPRYRSKSKKRVSQSATASAITSPSHDGMISGVSEPVALNYLRKVSEEGDAQTNSLIRQQQLYKERKAKPFQKLQKIKLCLYEVGIEGDPKRSLVKSIVLMPDKRIILFDRNNKCLKLFDNDFNPLDRLAINAKYSCLARVYSNTIVASMPEHKCLQLFHLDSCAHKIQRERTIALESEVYAIAHYDKQLYMFQRNRKTNLTELDEWEIKRMDLNRCDEQMATLRKMCPGHQDCMLWVNEQGVYVTNRLENEVLLLKHDGTLQERHKIEFSLPVGMASDKSGNLYVCGGSMTSFIEIFKPDLSKSKVIYQKTSSDLVAICHDSDHNRLYVCDKIHAKVICYKIEHSGTVQGLMRSLLMGSRENP